MGKGKLFVMVVILLIMFFFLVFFSRSVCEAGCGDFHIYDELSENRQVITVLLILHLLCKLFE